MKIEPFKLSPSRAKDYIQCPLLYKFKSIDKLPTLPTIEAVRGTHIHAILEHIFHQPPANRTIQAAIEQIWPQWDIMLKENPKYSEQIEDVGKISNENECRNQYYDSVITRLENYWKLENPVTLTNVTGMEMYLQTPFDDTVTLNGFIDRVEEVTSAGIRISDYKTGKKPAPAYELDALYQLYFYALLWLKKNGSLPTQLKLLYLGDAKTLVDAPNSNAIAEFEQDLQKLVSQIKDSIQTDTWEYKPSKLCDWCNFHDKCPGFS
jgi:putative RecB family exonuclease